jgi:tRNA pseudouridine55 synthase
MSQRTTVHGALVVHKPAGPSSHDIVVCARRALGVRRIGHTGTLDPQASGVLALVVGQATRLAKYLTGSDKAYLATLRFGVTTDTYDSAGTIVATRDTAPSREDVERALARFVGTFDQTPPPFSAKMVDGERAYALARAGRAVAPPASTVTAHAIEIVSFGGERAELRVRCSAGFYVRSLAHDLGTVLGCGAVLDGLVRTEAAGFGLSAAMPLDRLMTTPREAVRAAVRPMETLLTDVPAVTLTRDGVEWARHGRELPPRILTAPAPGAPSLVRLLDPDGSFVGLGEPGQTPGFLHPAVIFSYN